jgi:conjugative transfer region protein (TIGR03750 family)
MNHASNESSVKPKRLDLLLNHLNYDPIVYMGCSEKELWLIVLGIAAPLLVIGGIFGYLKWGNIPFGMLPGFVLSVIGVFVAISIVKRVKRDKEPGFLQQTITDQLEAKGVLKTKIIRRSGSWSVGRML